MPLHTPDAPSNKDPAAGLRPAKLSGSDRGCPDRPSFAGRLAEDGITLSLIHLDVALAVEPRGRDAGELAGGAPCFNVSAKRLAHDLDEVGALAPDNHEDPVIRRLSD